MNGRFNTKFLTIKNHQNLILCRFKKFLKAKHESELPEFVYAGKNIKPHTRIYVMGNTIDGALGVKHFIKPDKGRPYMRFIQFPFRLTFADINEVAEIGCGYGFTVFGLKGTTPSTFFGTGVATSNQIGCHLGKKRKPLEILLQPFPIPIPLTKGSSSKKIACGRAHTVIWTDSEGLWTFGNNSFGQCGRPVNEKEVYNVNAVFENIKMFNGKTVDQIECGQDTSFVLIDGQVYSCGWNADGQAGLGTYNNAESFQPVEGDLKGEKVIKISCRADCVLALTEKGDVFGWGNSEYRQLNSISSEQQLNTPRKLSLKNVNGKIIDIASGGTACYVLNDCNDVWSWGYGPLGVGPNNMCSEEPVVIPPTLLGRTVLTQDSKVTKLFAGIGFAAAVTDDGGLFSWGRNDRGNLGLGHCNYQYFPMRVCVASAVKRVSCGIDHMVIFAKSLV